MTELKTTELNKNTKLCSFDIENIYTNIPRKDIINIINNILENNTIIHANFLNEIIHVLKVIMKQNYFQFDQQYYEQIEGLAMGAPTSEILAEIFIQRIEHTCCLKA
jgi:hypothetical protein